LGFGLHCSNNTANSLGWFSDARPAPSGGSRVPIAEANATCSKAFYLAVGSVLLLCVNARGQHLWWNLERQTDANCLYGEITVLATNTGIYYCGANWHPGEPAGGYCGIQDNSVKERRTIFSVWDTSRELHPEVAAADARTLFNRFGGEGTGAHTHMVWPWKVGETFQFYVEKLPARKPDCTDARYYVYDRRQKKWLHSATITSPNGGKKSVATIGGGVNSFLENFTGRNRDVPKIALYRLWLGKSVETLKCLTRARGDGTWGRLHDAYFLAEGDATKLGAVFSQLEKQYGKPVMGAKGKGLDPISDKPVPPAVIKQLKHLPRAAEVKDKQATS